MSEFPSSGTNSNRFAQMSGDERFRFTLATVGILFFLTLAVVILRFHRLSEFPPGDYELRLVVYDFETLKPAVELGVWEPETVLTSLQLSDGR